MSQQVVIELNIHNLWLFASLCD